MNSTEDLAEPDAEARADVPVVTGPKMRPLDAPTVPESLRGRIEHIQSFSQMGAKVSHFEVVRARCEPPGNGVALARKSTQDPGFVGCFNQICEVIEKADRSSVDFDVQTIIMACDCSGARLFEERSDLLLMVREMTHRRYRFIGIRDATRISRCAQTFLDSKKVVDSAGAVMYIAWNDRVFDPEDVGDNIAAAIANEYAAYERAQTRRRTMSGTFDTRIAEGKGASCKPPFGFTKNEAGFWIQDVKDWPWVRAVHLIEHATNTHPEPDVEIARILKRECGVDLPVATIRSLLPRRAS